MIDEKKLDEQITEFTDQILGTEEIDMDEINPTGELAKLQKTILAMKAAVKSARPDESARARIHRNLMSAAREQDTKKNVIYVPRKISGIAFASSFALLVLLGIILVPLSGVDTPLTGTAEGFPVWLPLIIITGIAVIAFIAWFNRQR